MELGINRRLRRILPRKGSIVLPLDGALIDGPTGALRHVETLLSSKLLNEVDSILGYIGLLKRLPEGALDVPFIANMSGSTILHDPTQKVWVSNVELAVRYGVDAVSYQIHLSDKNEHAMLSNVGRLVSEASHYGLPVLVTAYPRRSLNGNIDTYDELRSNEPLEFATLIEHCVRVAVELGADIVKTTYPGSYEAMSQVIEAAMGVPIIIAGGKPVDLTSALEKARDSVRAGAWGVAYGRQIFLANSPSETARIIRSGMKSILI